MVGSAVIRAPASSPPLGLKAEPALGRRRHTNPADRQPLYAPADGRRRDFARCADYANACSRRRAGRRCLELCIGEEASILLATATRNVMAEMIRRSQHGHGAERRGRSGAVEQPRGGELGGRIEQPRHHQGGDERHHARSVSSALRQQIAGARQGRRAGTLRLTQQSNDDSSSLGKQRPSRFTEQSAFRGRRRRGGQDNLIRLITAWFHSAASPRPLAPRASSKPSSTFVDPALPANEVIQGLRIRLVRRRVPHHPRPLAPRPFVRLRRVGGAPDDGRLPAARWSACNILLAACRT
jgi:hypothetical protein